MWRELLGERAIITVDELSINSYPDGKGIVRKDP